MNKLCETHLMCNNRIILNHINYNSNIKHFIILEIEEKLEVDIHNCKIDY